MRVGVVVSARRSGKNKAWAQAIAVFVVLLAGAAAWGNWLLLAMAGMWLAAALQVPLPAPWR